ncbi:hypothetical protein [Streptomyces sp. A5-4]|uniref:hypothetical protein n=1 Tax=Streptomyces sp. A5-4 TaxID=3384771 RepID=UPI003DA8091D
MSTTARTTPDDLARYAHLWRPTSAPRQWVIWNTAGETMIFDREINCPVDVGDGTQREVLRKMREAGVPESDDYPGRPCS